MSINLKELLKYPICALLPQPVAMPETLHGKCPRILLGKEWWDKTRKRIYSKAAGRCMFCGINFRLTSRPPEAHERFTYDKKKYIATYVDVVAICYYCHRACHYAHTMRQHRMRPFSPKEQEEIKTRIGSLRGYLFEFTDSQRDAEWKVSIDGKLY